MVSDPNMCAGCGKTFTDRDEVWGCHIRAGQYLCENCAGTRQTPCAACGKTLPPIPPGGTALAADFAADLVAFSKALGELALQIEGDEGEMHPLWILIDRFHGILSPGVYRPDRGIQELEGALSSFVADRYHLDYCPPQSAEDVIKSKWWREAHTVNS